MQEEGPVPYDDPPDDPPLLLRGTRKRHQVKQYGLLVEAETSKMKAYIATQNPQSYKEAMAISDWDNWVEARVREMESLIDTDVFELVPWPKGKHAFGFC